jgi:hypothetical protein
VDADMDPHRFTAVAGVAPIHRLLQLDRTAQRP